MAQMKNKKAQAAAQPKSVKPEEVQTPNMQEAETPTPETQAPQKPAMSVFDHAVGFVLQEKIEGGYVNDPRDPGGETNFGISKRAYPKVDIKNLTKDAAIAIYKSDYWDAVCGGDLPAKIAIAVFDAAINQGNGAAKRLLQKAAGTTADGIIGPQTLSAVTQANEEALLIQFLSWRLRRYAHTANSATYMRGWSARVLELQHFLHGFETKAA